MGLSSEYLEKKKLDEMRDINKKLDRIMEMLLCLSLQLGIFSAEEHLSFPEESVKEMKDLINTVMRDATERD